MPALSCLVCGEMKPFKIAMASNPVTTERIDGWQPIAGVCFACCEARVTVAAFIVDMRRMIGEMRSERSRYKSHDLGLVDSVAAHRVDEWADELETLLRDSGTQ